MASKYHSVTIKPIVGDVLPNQAYTADDLLFDSKSFQIPKGTCAIKTINAIIPGTNSNAQIAATTPGANINLFFATTYNGAAPTSLGTLQSQIGKIAACKNRFNIIASQHLDVSEMVMGEGMTSFSVLGSGKNNQISVILNGDTEFSGDSTNTDERNNLPHIEGYQTIWVAATIQDALDLGTNVLLDGAILTGAAGAQTLDVSEDQDADDVFAIGDELVACAANGTSVQQIGTVTALGADTITVDAKDIYGNTVWASGALVDDDEICFRRPIVLRFGIEY